MSKDKDFDPSEKYREHNPLIVKPEHIKLLRAMNVRWNTPEYGAPEVDPKRPYGDSYVADSIREITGMETADDEWCRKRHREMEAVLQVWLRHGELSPGDKVCFHKYKWRLVSEIDGDAP